MKKVVLALPFIIAACTAPEQASVEDAFNVNYLDTSVAPCEDFFQHTAGGWIAENPIPETETRWGRFNELIETNKHRLKTILEEVSAGTYEKGTDEQLIGDLFASAMDSISRNAAGLVPLLPYLEEVDNVESIDQLFTLMGQNKFNGIGAPLSMYVSTDAKNSSAHALYVGQSGIGLPDRDYYLREDSASLVLQQQYRDHIAKVSALVGGNWDVDAIYNLEKSIAQAMKSRVEMRNSVARYNPMTLEQWQALAPNMPITAYFNAVGVQADTLINSSPEFFSRFNEACAKSGLETWKQYYQWHVADAAANLLNDEFETLNFEFYSKTLRGIPKMNPRWKRAQGAVGSLGDQLGHLYADRYFPEESKAQVEAMVEDLRSAFRDRINGLTWMSDTTKEKALAKLDAFTYKIGYPDTWEDLSDLDLSRASYFENSKALSNYFTEDNLSKLDEPVDKEEWGMGAHIVNAYYNPLNNEVVFPAGILQPPFFSPDADDAINYGAIGGVIGHEFSHGFDDQGANYGADGNLENWWTAGDKKRFDELTTKLADQYDAYEVLPGVNVNGRLTLGENIADLGGLTLAYHAYLKHRGDNEVVFPAGILQPPFFSPDADDAINYGAIGGVIGHEFSHGFDDQGANYGADGNLENWWTAGDKKRFDELTTKLADQYDAYEVLPGVNVNGRLTLGENIADLGGLTLAYHAYLKHRGDKEVAPIDGFTDKQRIFLGWAQVWQMHGREEYLKNQVVTDPHSPGKFRVNGPMSNMPEFVEAFGGVCTNGGLAKAKEDQIIIW